MEKKKEHARIKNQPRSNFTRNRERQKLFNEYRDKLFRCDYLCSMHKDFYHTISSPSEGIYTEKRSKFLAFAFPVFSTEDVKQIVETHQKKYYDARHVCYAYIIGAEKLIFRANDNGEPSGTAGKPILGQINSNELTNILILVVRYFGGIKLGTSGLAMAYRRAAAEAIANATIIERTIDENIHITFNYFQINDVMKIIKDSKVQMIDQTFEMNCTMTLRIRKSLLLELCLKLKKIESLRFDEDRNL